jgi:hypothetical protein
MTMNLPLLMSLSLSYAIVVLFSKFSFQLEEILLHFL